jgi:hypothetical protein
MNRTPVIACCAICLAACAAAQQPGSPIYEQPVTGKGRPIVPVRAPATAPIPDAPSSSSVTNHEETSLPREEPRFWTLGDAEHAIRTNRQVFHDKTWLGVQGFWLGTIVYDTELTHQGLAHHNCVEGNAGLGPDPSRGDLYRYNMLVYTVGTSYNWLVMRFVGKPLIFTFPAVNSFQHLRGGSKWLADCW